MDAGRIGLMLALATKGRLGEINAVLGGGTVDACCKRL